jgi:hypothetical protein
MQNGKAVPRKAGTHATHAPASAQMHSQLRHTSAHPLARQPLWPSNSAAASCLARQKPPEAVSGTTRPQSACRPAHGDAPTGQHRHEPLTHHTLKLAGHAANKPFTRQQPDVQTHHGAQTNVPACPARRPTAAQLMVGIGLLSWRATMHGPGVPVHPGRACPPGDIEAAEVHASHLPV